MFNNLPETLPNQGQRKRVSRYIRRSMLAMTLTLTVLVVGNLFQYDINLSEIGDFKSLMAPVVVSAMEQPPAPAPRQSQAPQQLAAPNEPPQAPRPVLFIDYPAPPGPSWKIPDGSESPVSGRQTGGDQEAASGSPGLGSPTGDPNGTVINTEPPPPPPPPPPAPKAAPVVEPPPPPAPPTVQRSSGPLNGKALNLVQPSYPEAARRLSISGQVRVEITIGENGRVIDAKVTGGHILLRQGVEQAARSSVFAPTTLNGKPIKVSGYITYNFTK